MDREMSNVSVLKLQKGLYIELAAMFKEHIKGGDQLTNKIKGLFCLQEGISMKKANLYYDLLVSAGLIKYTNGHKSWRYDSKAEWELFQVEI
jgi:hypothetical protein